MGSRLYNTENTVEACRHFSEDMNRGFIVYIMLYAGFCGTKMKPGGKKGGRKPVE